MREARNVLLATVAALAVMLMFAAAGAARMPSAIQTTSYVWAQPPAWVGVVPPATVVPQSTDYVWGQPPSWIPISG
jgi:hypothetical protein